MNLQKITYLTAPETKNPAVENLLSHLRDKNTNQKTFKQIVYTLSTLLAQETLKDEQLTSKTIQTPLGETSVNVLDETNYVIIWVLRAGWWMMKWVKDILPNAEVWFIWQKRDEETFLPIDYYVELPKDIAEKKVLLLDPMLATWGSITSSINLLNDNWVKDEQIKFLNIVAAPEWVEYLNKNHPEVEIFSAVLDSHLNENAYIVPWLWDAWDRLFWEGTIWQKVLEKVK